MLTRLITRHSSDEYDFCARGICWLLLQGDTLLFVRELCMSQRGSSKYRKQQMKEARHDVGRDELAESKHKTS